MAKRLRDASEDYRKVKAEGRSQLSCSAGPDIPMNNTHTAAAQVLLLEGSLSVLPVIRQSFLTSLISNPSLDVHNYDFCVLPYD